MKTSVSYHLPVWFVEATEKGPTSRSETVNRLLKLALSSPEALAQCLVLRMKREPGPSKRVTLRLDVDLYSELKSLSERTDLSQEQIIRLAAEML